MAEHGLRQRFAKSSCAVKSHHRFKSCRFRHLYPWDAGNRSTWSPQQVRTYYCATEDVEARSRRRLVARRQSNLFSRCRWGVKPSWLNVSTTATKPSSRRTCHVVPTRRKGSINTILIRCAHDHMGRDLGRVWRGFGRMPRIGEDSATSGSPARMT